jgi:hypothetical protein
MNGSVFRRLSSEPMIAVGIDLPVGERCSVESWKMI